MATNQLSWMSRSVKTLEIDLNERWARITIDYGGATQMNEISIASNFESQNPTVQTFGLGSAGQVDELTIQWPDGLLTVLTLIPAGQFITVDHPDL